MNTKTAGKTELSIAGPRAPSLWLAAYFRRLGLRAHLGMPR